MTNYKINKEKCLGCGACVAISDNGTELGEDGKAKVIDNKKIEAAGGESICPHGAIEIEK